MAIIAGIVWIALLTGCTTGNNPKSIYNPINATDTVLLFKKDTVIVTGSTASYGAWHFPKKNTWGFSTNSKVLLLLREPKVITAPEGVYEIYLTNSFSENDKLSSSQKSFVSLLDLYSFTAPGAKQLVEIDITMQVINLYSAGEPLSPFYAILKFAPARLADGTFSVHAGKVHFSGFSVIKVTE